MKKVLNILTNMGPRYVAFRLWYEARRRTGLLKAAFPTQRPLKTYSSLAAWKKLDLRFFFEAKESLAEGMRLAEEERQKLIDQLDEYRQGRLLMFSATYYEVADWLTNPSNGYRYDATKHWTDIPDLSPVAGDIKYVWEKSRFAFLYPLIRGDFYLGENNAEIVFQEIESWIDANPINCGPNWRCSQEISLRVLNWTFALHYYKNSSALTEARFEKLMHVLYWQMRHVEENIDFSRIAVRNNHAITETLALYLVGLLYPSFPDAPRWKQRGKKWFEEEIAYQIYEDGTFLQFSMNYHRVVIQLLTWAIRLSELNGESFSERVYHRAKASLEFLRVCQDTQTGWLPNYGNNDGALFFPLNSAHYRDYRPQLSALEAALGVPTQMTEDCFWFGTTTISQPTQKPFTGTFSFEKGGYYVVRDVDESVTFVRCGAYKDRPFQADNLHLDVWVNGQNLLRDAGSYLYNTDEKWTRYFAGTASHNTVMLGTYDQMQKGPRFVWYNWVKEATASWKQQDKTWIFEGQIEAFAQVGKGIIHRRKVQKKQGELVWVVEDWLENAPTDLPMHQIWHPSEIAENSVELAAFDKQGNPLSILEEEGWYSSLYGKKEACKRWVISHSEHYIKTEIFVESGF